MHHFNKGYDMYKTLLAVCLAGLAGFANAESIASSPNDGNGKIVLTDEACIHKGKPYPPLKRAYTFTGKGNTFEGCYGVEDDTVVVVWILGNETEKRRYPISNFTLTRKGNI